MPWGSAHQGIITSHIHAPLQLCIVASNQTHYQQFAVTLMVITTIYGGTIQSCSGTWVWLLIIIVIINCKGLFLCLLHLFNFAVVFYSFFYHPLD